MMTPGTLAYCADLWKKAEDRLRVARIELKTANDKVTTLDGKRQKITEEQQTAERSARMYLQTVKQRSKEVEEAAIHWAERNSKGDIA